MTRAATPEPAQTSPDHVVPGGWFTFAFMLALTLFAFVDRQVLVIVAAPMAAELRLGDGQLGLLLGLGSIAFSTLCVFPIAWAADRFDRRIILAICIAVWSLGTAACGLAHNFNELFLATIAVSAGEGAIAPICMAIVPELFFGRKRVLANALNYIFGYLGISLGIAIGGVALSGLSAAHGVLPSFLQSFSSWRLAFLLVATPAPVYVAVTYFVRLSRTPRTAASAQRPSVPLISYVRAHLRAFLLVNGALALYILAFGCYFNWLPTVNTRLFHTSGSENGVGMALSTALGMFGGVAIGALMMRWLIVRLGPAASLRIAWITAAVSTPIFVLFTFIAAAWQGYALLGLLMLSGTAIGSLVPNMLQSMAPGALRARVIAIYTVFSSVFAGLAPTLVGLVSHALGGQPRQLLWAMTLVALPCWLLSTLLFRLSEGPFRKLAGAAEAIEQASTPAASEIA